MAQVVDDLAARTPGKRSLAMAAYARALRQIPTIICDNAGEKSASPRERACAGGGVGGMGALAGQAGVYLGCVCATGQAFCPRAPAQHSTPTCVAVCARVQAWTLRRWCRSCAPRTPATQRAPAPA